MSWDLYVQDWGNVKSLTDIPEGYEPKPIGKRSEIISRIQKIEPLVDFRDRLWDGWKMINSQLNLI